MLKSEFQGAPSFQILSPQGGDLKAKWTLAGLRKEYDARVKGYVFAGARTTSRAVFPAPAQERGAPRRSFLTQPFLVLQLLVPAGTVAPLVVELSIGDAASCAQTRLHLSTAVRQTKVTPLHAQIPLRPAMVWGQWINLGLDVVALAEALFPRLSYRSLDSITITGVFSLRRVFTLREAPRDDAALALAIPSALQLSLGTADGSVASRVAGPWLLTSRPASPPDATPNAGVADAAPAKQPHAPHIAFGKSYLPPAAQSGIPRRTLAAPLRGSAGSSRGRGSLIGNQVVPPTIAPIPSGKSDALAPPHNQSPLEEKVQTVSLEPPALEADTLEQAPPESPLPCSSAGSSPAPDLHTLPNSPPPFAIPGADLSSESSAGQSRASPEALGPSSAPSPQSPTLALESPEHTQEALSVMERLLASVQQLEVEAAARSGLVTAYSEECDAATPDDSAENLPADEDWDDGEECLELDYDAVQGCYVDPATGKLYQLIADAQD